LSQRLMQVNIPRSPRAAQNEFYILQECRNHWDPPEPPGYILHHLRLPDSYRPENRAPCLVIYLPYADFVKTARCLSDVHLRKMMIESYLVLRALRGEYPLSQVWKTEPHNRVVKMWSGYYSWLQRYYNEMVLEWRCRGYATELGTTTPYDTIRALDETSFLVSHLDRGYYPPWLGYPPLHESHRATLYAEDSTVYHHFQWANPGTEGLVWPILVSPTRS
jgi:hypothetical protein